MNPVSRREFLVVSAAAGGGLLLGWSWQTAGAQETASVFAPNAFIRIGTDGRVTLIMGQVEMGQDRKSTRLNSSHGYISYAVFCLKKKKELTKMHLVNQKE